MALEWCFDALLAVYDRALVVALRHRFITLMVMLGTVAVTAWLFIVIPKGFFPEQDTGLILGVTEAAQDISPAGMSTLQQQVIGAGPEGSGGCDGRRLYRRGRCHLDRESGTRLHRAQTEGRALVDYRCHGQARPGDAAVSPAFNCSCSRCRISISAAV